MKFKYLLIILLQYSAVKSQIKINGKVVDKITKEVLSFSEINILGNDEIFLSDIDGDFIIQNKGSFNLLVSYYGYKSENIYIDYSSDNLIIELQKIEDTVFYHDEKAYNIIREVVNNKDINNPYKYKSFEYRSYNKVVIDKENYNGFGFCDFLKIDILKSDTSITDDDKVKILENSVHILFGETISTRRYLNSESEEKILFSKLSGVKNPKLPIIGREFQSFSFYDDVIDIMSKYYVNPISNYGIDKYSFKLVNVIGDTLYKIVFKPSTKNINGIEGIFFINKNKYALYAIDISSMEEIPLIKIKQKYTLIKDKWFPSELYYKYTQRLTPMLSLAKLPVEVDDKKYTSYFDFFKDKLKGVYEVHFLEGKNYIKDIVINENVEDNLNWEEVITSEIEYKDEKYWNENRVKKLSLIEKNTYIWLDSQNSDEVYSRIKSNRNLFDQDRYIDNTSYYLEFDVDKLLKYNNYEGFRTEMALNTTEKFSNKLIFGGYIGYGFKDEGIKYGGNFSINILKQERLSFLFEYKRDVFQVGSYGKNFGLISNIFGYKYDKSEIFKLNVGSRFFKYLKLDLDLNVMNINPQYDLSEYRESKYNITYIGLNLKYAYKEKFFSIDDIFTIIDTYYPVINFKYQYGFKDFLNGDYTYNKFEFNISQELNSPFGLTRYFIEGGFIDRVIPYGQMFTAEGINNDLNNTKNYIYVKRKFQTMYYYEFLSDRYINIFTSHNFKNVLYLFRILEQDIIMDIILDNNFSIGYLNDKENFLIRNIKFNVKEKVYMETGLTFNFGFLGFGVFYRYGDYSFKNISDNLFYKIGFFLNVEGDRISRARTKKMNIVSYFLYN